VIASIAAAVYGVEWIQSTFSITSPIAGFVVFVLVALVVSRLLSWVVGALDLMRKFFSVIPFVGFLNSLFGALGGAVQAAFLCLAVAFVCVSYIPQSDTRTIVLSSHTMRISADLLITLGLGR
jgi:hypothetical protein